jgi:hypothetical protein
LLRIEHSQSLLRQYIRLQVAEANLVVSLLAEG